MSDLNAAYASAMSEANAADPLHVQHLPGTVDGTVDRELVALVDAARAVVYFMSPRPWYHDITLSIIRTWEPEVNALRAALAPYSEDDAA